MLTQLLILSGLLASAPALAENTPPKANASTSVYENETESPKTKSFAAKVKVIRDETDSVEVFFSGDDAKGGYFLYRSHPHFAEYLHRLEESRKPQGPKAKVIAEDEDKKIITVEPTPKAPTKSGWD